MRKFLKEELNIIQIIKILGGLWILRELISIRQAMEQLLQK